MNTQTANKQMQLPQLPTSRQPLQLQKQLLVAQRQVQTEKERLKTLEAREKDLEAKQQALFKKYDIATQDEILSLCIENGTEEIFISLCQRLVLPRTVVKEKIKFCQEVKGLAKASGIDHLPLMECIEDVPALIQTSIALIKQQTNE